MVAIWPILKLLAYGLAILRPFLNAEENCIFKSLLEKVIIFYDIRGLHSSFEDLAFLILLMAKLAF